MLSGAFWGQLGRVHTMWILLTHMVEACKEGLLTQTLSKAAAALASWQLGQSILLFIKDHKSIIKADWGPAWQMPWYELSLSQTSRSLLQQDLSTTLKGLISCKNSLLSSVLSTTGSVQTRLSLRALGSPCGSSWVCWCSTHSVSSWGLAVGTKTVQDNSWIDCSVFLAGLLSTCLLLVLSSHPTSPVPCSPKAMGSGDGPAPGRAVPAQPGGLGEPGWKTPKQQRFIPFSCSTSHSHSFQKGWEVKGTFPSFSSITTDCSFTCCLHRLPGKSPAELYHHSHLKRVGQNYIGFTTAAASTIWAVGWVRPAQKWHLLNKPTVSAGYSTATCPAFPPE